MSLGFRPSVTNAATNLVIDAATARLFRLLRSHRVDAILLKGPSFARWLYDEPHHRTYVDIDVLVAPDDVDDIDRVLVGAGYARLWVELPHDRPWYARSYRSPEGVVVEAHRNIPGIDLAAEAVWPVLATRTAEMSVGEETVRVFDEAARVMHVVLHAWHHDGTRAQAVEDVRRARGVVREETWRDAEALAVRLSAERAFRAGIETGDGGPAATRPRLERTRHPAYQAASWLLALPTLRLKLRYLRAKLFPPAEFLRGWSALARRHRAGLVAAYLIRPLWVVARGLRGLAMLRRKSG